LTASLLQKFSYVEEDFEESKRTYEHQLEDKRPKKQLKKQTG